MNTGKIIQIIGPVVDVRFDATSVPNLYNALTVLNNKQHLTLEVVQHIGNDCVRTIAMGPTDGLARHLEVVDTGGAISVPVGENVLGRMFNVLGEPIDEMDFDDQGLRHSIHREAPAFKDQSVETKVLETGIKVIDLLCPFPVGGKVGLFGGAGVGKTVLMQESSFIISQ